MGWGVRRGRRTRRCCKHREQENLSVVRFAPPRYVIDPMTITWFQTVCACEILLYFTRCVHPTYTPCYHIPFCTTLLRVIDRPLLGLEPPNLERKKISKATHYSYGGSALPQPPLEFSRLSVYFSSRYFFTCVTFSSNTCFTL